MLSPDPEVINGKGVIAMGGLIEFVKRIVANVIRRFLFVVGVIISAEINF